MKIIPYINSKGIAVFYKWAECGSVTMHLDDQFWGAKFGMLTDKFGIIWMLNCNKPGQPEWESHA